MAKTQQLTVKRRKIEVSNLNKLVYPGKKFTKAKVIDYYIQVSKSLLPHFKDRPVTLKRFPDGVFGQFFYEKDAPEFTPDWIKTFPVPRRETPGPHIRYILVNDLPTLVWLANFDTVELHPFLHRVPRIANPTAIVFDCDPGEGADILSCCQVALLLRDLLMDLRLESLVKTSGSKGLQVYVPLNSRVTYDETQSVAKAISQILEEREPKLIVSAMPKNLRHKKVFIDWSQNADFKTTVGVYSLRATTYRPYVSAPVHWDEVSSALNDRDAESLYFTPEVTLKRIETYGDIFEVVQTKKQRLPAELQQYFKDEQKRSQRSNQALQLYVHKRDFDRTAEPKPRQVRRSRQGSRRRFVVQKHAASHLHYDFRLEMHDVLKSWSIPKGPPFTLGERRLAMPTEDHPLDYLEFEGIIPKGQYGGGTVMVWDIGTYEVIEGNYYKGFLRIHLKGMKLKGEWILERNNDLRNDRDTRDKWQMVKSDKSTRTVSKVRDDQSAISKRTMAQIAKSADAVWHSNRGASSD